MRSAHCTPGARVRVTGGKLKGMEGTIRTGPGLRGEFSTYFGKASVQFDDGEIRLVSPRWMEAA